MKKVIVALLVAVLVIALVPPVALAGPDREKPVPATNVELVKKVTLHGKPHGGGKPSKYAATGDLGAPCTGTKYAVVVGISDYPGDSSDLEYADDDAEEMEYVLWDVYGYSKANIRLLLDMSASFGEIEEAISDIRGKEELGDEVVFFFSGHGASGRAMDGDKERIDEAIVTHDGNEQGKLEYIWDGQLAQWFSGFDTSRIIFIFDTCLAGGMTDLKVKGSQRVINMSTTERGTAYESDQWGGGHGQFSYYFVVEGMSEGYANVHDYGSGTIGEPEQVTVEEAYDYAKANCKWQKPTINDSFGDDLLL